MQFTNSNYYSAMDDLNGDRPLTPLEANPVDSRGDEIVPDDALNFTARDIGTTTNPMGNTLESLKARIREGASRIEFEFIGQGKGSSQNPTPESFGSLERQDIRELLKVNDMKTSTHASLHSQSLAGFGREGFNVQERATALKEIKKAIDFASEATKGGAIVFHLHEWQRPMSEIRDKSEASAQFRAYDTEDTEATLFTVDKRTGRVVSGVSKDTELYRPVYITAKDRGLAGRQDASGNVLRPDDWVDLNGNLIPKNASVERLFDRVPSFDKDNTNFRVEKLKWDQLVKEKDEYNQLNPDKPISTEEMYARIQLENRVLQAKGSSLYHAKEYEHTEKEYDDFRQIYDRYKKIYDESNEEQKPKIKALLRQELATMRIVGTFDDPFEALKSTMDRERNMLRYIHEASASADVQARESEEMMRNVVSAKTYGIEKTADTIAQAAIYAMEAYKSRKDKYGLEEPIYVAPENWHPQMFGSHPEEYKEIIEKSRKTMTNFLKNKGHSEEEAKRLAKQHIKGTLDIGHLNQWRSHFIADEKTKESPEEAEKRFEKWLLDQAEDLVKKGYVGHIHLTDNFGFDDEHLTPGQGNVPMKEFMKRLEKAGIKDIIVEQGSFNPLASIETLNLVNSPIYGVGKRARFNQVRNQHFGYNAPGFFIAGSYVPSNDWRPWTDIPLE